MFEYTVVLKSSERVSNDFFVKIPKKDNRDCLHLSMGELN